MLLRRFVRGISIVFFAKSSIFAILVAAKTYIIK
jgi:hypothetical protein